VRLLSAMQRFRRLTGVNDRARPGDDLPEDRDLLAAAAQAVIAAFRVPGAEQLPPASMAALRLLETALMLYEDQRRATEPRPKSG
jgi:hypothetical protein